MEHTLTPSMLEPVLERLARANGAYRRVYPGESRRRQPVHTVYGGAHLFRAGLARKLGDAALRVLRGNAGDFADFARLLELPGAERLPEAPDEVARLEQAFEQDREATRLRHPEAWLARSVHRRVIAKLEREPVEDFRIDFEDGYGNRADEEEDGHACQAAREVAEGMVQGSLPPFLGIRIKPFSEEFKARAIRTLDLFLSTLAAATGGKLPENFVVTLPKVVLPEQVAALVDLFELLESETALEAGALELEIMVETPQSVLNAGGGSALPALVEAARGRCSAAHFGVYDYTASSNITANFQRMRHPGCDFARTVMQVSLAGRGVWISDGATNILPVGPHAARGGELTPRQKEENREAVRRAWKIGFDDIRHSLESGYYQGWDLHPAQFPIRYAAVYAFFLEQLEEATARLRAFLEQAARASLMGDVFDDAATGQGLLNFFLAAFGCGAITEEELARTGLTPDQMATRSFSRILREKGGRP